MRINVRYDKMLNIKTVVNGSAVEVPERCPVRDLFDVLDVPRHRRGLIQVFVNDQAAWKSTVLKENDQVILHIAVGGG